MHKQWPLLRTQEGLGTRLTHSILFFPFSAEGSYKEGDIRLIGGSYNWEGRVEIYWTGTWGAISDTSWSNSDAEVVCRQLRHSENGVYMYVKAPARISLLQ